ncbi:MAG: hypothetical protein AAF467_04095 [Actinomycetota bacterium]
MPDIVFPIITLSIGAAIAGYAWRRSRTVALVTLGWAVLSLATARIDYFETVGTWSEGDEAGSTLFNIVGGVPVVLLVLAWWRLPAFRSFVMGTPSWVFALSQVYRVTGISLLFLYADDLLPAEIGVTNAVMDVVIGLTAPLVAVALHRGVAWARAGAIAWNVFGLADFVIAGAFISLSLRGVIELSPAPSQMGIYPVSLITVYQVAIAFFVHIVLLWRLVRRPHAAADQMGEQGAAVSL